MTAFGNLFLVISALLYIGLTNILYFKTVPRGGDYVVGYAWSILILNAAFIVSIILAYSIIGLKSGFTWVGNSSTSRFIIVAGVLLSILITNALSGLFKNEHGDVPAFFISLSFLMPIILPALLITAGFILVNNFPIAASFYKWPLTIAGAIGILGTIGFLGVFLFQQAANSKAIMEGNARFEDNNHMNMLKHIDSCDISKDMVFLFVYTDANQYPDVREKALARIKTNPSWQQELVNKLHNDWAPEAFTYLASNPVDSTELFTAPLKQGILIQAKLIRESIRRSSHPSHFYASQFSWEIERVLRTVDKFKSVNENYLSEVKQLRAALNEPSEFEKPAFICIPFLDKWIKQNQ